jgi:hypothetical protein
MVGEITVMVGCKDRKMPPMQTGRENEIVYY